MRKEIKDLEDIKFLVNHFYDKVRVDELIGPVFHGAIHDWSFHLEKMYRFWETILLNNQTYFGSPFPPHAQLPVEWKHFDRWLSLFATTLDEYFIGEKAEEAKWRADRMALTFNSKIEYFKNNPQSKPLI